MQKTLFSPTVFTSRGNIELLSQNKIALFASRQTPKAMEKDIFLFFDKLRQLPLGLSSGWQSPVEKKLFQRMNAYQTANVLQYYARELNSVQLTQTQENLIQQNKLLMLAPETSSRRPNAKLVEKRDALLFSQNKKVLFFYIEQGGRLEQYFRILLQGGYSIFFMEHELNQNFYDTDITILNPENLDVLTFVK